MRTGNWELGLTPCRTHLRMKGPQPDGEPGFLRSQARALEEDSPRFRRGGPGFFFAGDLFHLQRLARRPSHRSFVAYGKESIPCSDGKCKDEVTRETLNR